MPEIIPNLHPMFVHFPIALISVSAFFHVTALAVRGKPCATHCAILAHTTLWLGALAVLPTVFFGWLAFNSVTHDDSGHVAMLTHRAWALTTLAVLLVLAGWDVWRNKADSSPSWWFVVAVIGAWVLVVTTAWHGSELVYRHGLGVMALPGVEGTGHAHGNDHSAGHDIDDHAQHDHAH